MFIFFTGLERVYEFQRYDGWYNNLANPHWGTVGRLFNVPIQLLKTGFIYQAKS